MTRSTLNGQRFQLHVFILESKSGWIGPKHQAMVVVVLGGSQGVDMGEGLKCSVLMPFLLERLEKEGVLQIPYRVHIRSSLCWCGGKRVHGKGSLKEIHGAAGGRGGGPTQQKDRRPPTYTWGKGFFPLESVFLRPSLEGWSGSPSINTASLKCHSPSQVALEECCFPSVHAGPTLCVT